MQRSMNEQALSPDDEILPGVVWGRRDWAFSPAFWLHIARDQNPESDAYRCSPSTPLAHEVAFCMLGGFGIKMEVNKAAWNALFAHGLLETGRRPSAVEIETVLRVPLQVSDRLVRYRFPRQRAQRLAYALSSIEKCPPPTSSTVEFRTALMGISGIGPKTASWLARNWLGSEDVAILDVHVLRAGRLMGLFGSKFRLPRDYQALESRFLEFSRVIAVPPSVLDAVIWREMRIAPRSAKLTVAS
jgi:thermostable 8-oxoguanine DNA glycosylase